MKIFNLPDRVLGIVFDMDGTLYSHPAYLAWQESSQVARLADWLGIDAVQAAQKMRAAREARRASGLPATSMANLFLEFGVEMSEIVRWREEDFIPAKWLKPNQTLNRALGNLARDYRLALLTNNPQKVGFLSLEALGVSKHFNAIIGLDDSGESKPSRLPFLRACESLSLSPQACVSVGDREDVDIKPALALGMGGILVGGLEDVYALSEFLKA